jgi:hypothetical protein
MVDIGNKEMCYYYPLLGFYEPTAEIARAKGRFRVLVTADRRFYGHGITKRAKDILGGVHARFSKAKLLNPKREPAPPSLIKEVYQFPVFFVNLK